MKPKKVGAERWGRLSESIAAVYLRAKGYRILARRHKTPLGEIDVIASRGKMVVAVEVKFRQSVTAAKVSISATQQRRISQAFSLFLSRHPKLSTHTCRFDAILITPKKWPVHIQNAWQIHGF